MPAGRPSSYTPEQATEICEHISGGGSLAEWCKKQGVAPSTVFRWLEANPNFRASYTRARHDQADADADLINDLARRATLPRTHADYVDPNAARVAIDALKWTASKRNARLYGDKIAIEMPRAPQITRGEQIAQLQESAIDVEEIVQDWTQTKLIDSAQSDGEPEVVNV